MRPTASWMTEIDQIILDYMYDVGREHDHRVLQPPATVWLNLHDELELINKSSSTVRRRLKTLTDKNLLEEADKQGTYYRLTKDGIRYVEGRMDRDELEEIGMDASDDADDLEDPDD